MELCEKVSVTRGCGIRKAHRCLQLYPQWRWAQWLCPWVEVKAGKTLTAQSGQGAPTTHPEQTGSVSTGDPHKATSLTLCLWRPWLSIKTWHWFFIVFKRNFFFWWNASWSPEARQVLLTIALGEDGEDKRGQMSSSHRQRSERNLSKEELGTLPPWNPHLNLAVFAHCHCPQVRQQGQGVGVGPRGSLGPSRYVCSFWCSV